MISFRCNSLYLPMNHHYYQCSSFVVLCGVVHYSTYLLYNLLWFNYYCSMCCSRSLRHLICICICSKSSHHHHHHHRRHCCCCCINLGNYSQFSLPLHPWKAGGYPLLQPQFLDRSFVLYLSLIRGNCCSLPHLFIGVRIDTHGETTGLHRVFLQARVTRPRTHASTYTHITTTTQSFCSLYNSSCMHLFPLEYQINK
jgi:hypothetical protein